MTKFKGRIAAASALALGAALVAAPASAKKIEGSYICVFKEGAVAKGQERASANRAASAAGGQVGRVYTHAIRGFSANISAQGAARMQAANRNIAWCEQDQIATTGQGRGKPGGGGGGGGTDPQRTPWGIDRVGGAGNGTGKRAWVIDTGIDADHPDLNVNASLSVNYAKGKSWDDSDGHGTHVAGTIAAKNNTIGVVGVAAGAEVVAVRVLGRNGGSYTDVIAGVDYVAANGSPGDVANMSLGGGYSAALNIAVQNAAAGGIAFVLAAGNESTDANTKSPASANGPNVYTISSFAQGDVWSSFSNYGNPPVDFAEPGSAILSTYKDGGYATLSGTSMAAPHAAGILLLGSINPSGKVLNDPDGNDDIIGSR